MVFFDPLDYWQHVLHHHSWTSQKPLLLIHKYFTLLQQLWFSIMPKSIAILLDLLFLHLLFNVWDILDVNSLLLHIYVLLFILWISECIYLHIIYLLTFNFQECLISIPISLISIPYHWVHMTTFLPVFYIHFLHLESFLSLPSLECLSYSYHFSIFVYWNNSHYFSVNHSKQNYIILHMHYILNLLFSNVMSLEMKHKNSLISLGGHKFHFLILIIFTIMTEI